jgi:hypothetical protein
MPKWYHAILAAIIYVELAGIVSITMHLPSPKPWFLQPKIIIYDTPRQTDQEDEDVWQDTWDKMET